MVNIKEAGDNVLFEVHGRDKLWTFTNQLSIPKHHIVNVYRNDFETSGWTGWKSPGINIPFLITAGTFYLRDDKVFRDVTNPANAIIIELKDEEYRKMVIEVEHPNLAIKFLEGCTHCRHR